VTEETPPHDPLDYPDPNVPVPKEEQREGYMYRKDGRPVVTPKLKKHRKLVKGFEENRGKGRPKGSPNKTSKKIKEAIARVLEGNSHNLEQWIMEVAADDPAKAIDLFGKLAEYVLPKKARVDAMVEHKGNVTYVVQTGIPAPPNSYKSIDIDEEGNVIDVVPKEVEYHDGSDGSDGV